VIVEEPPSWRLFAFRGVRGRDAGLRISPRTRKTRSAGPALVRHNFDTGHGALELERAFPIAAKLKGYVQIFNGFGKSMIDYDHSQTTIGAGFLVVDGSWRRLERGGLPPGRASTATMRGRWRPFG